ncbi:MAG: KOW domain-containing RNA-binding protein [Oscillospiraceae bacterium]|jgi:ribosomal protein L14E/L6E/L27E|nr:KOW domain-containing RNA-binding protein [Oscillospiraceae bacterium]
MDTVKIETGDIVRSINGRDAGGLFFAVRVDGEYLELADGRGRRIEKPKRKKLKHTQRVAYSESRAAEKLRSGEKITNAELRRAISELGGDADNEGGMQVG